MSEALRAQAAVGIRESVEPKSAAVSVGRGLATELPPLPTLGRSSRERAEHEIREIRNITVEQVAAPRPASVKPAEQAMEPAVLAERAPAERVEQAAGVESAEHVPVGERAERAEQKADFPGDPEPAVAAAVQEIDIDIDVDVEIDVEDLGDPRASERRLLYFLRDRFINAPERVEAALAAYRGKYSTIAQYVREVISVEPMADWLRPYLDIDTLARDWRREGIIWVIDDPGGNGEGPGVHIFLG
ncbi:MAG TPA: hypothetical protein ENK31_08155 [Nannocystis exedens]|nr:hypothetical protein [Nannocystis exedens]